MYRLISYGIIWIKMIIYINGVDIIPSSSTYNIFFFRSNTFNDAFEGERAIEKLRKPFAKLYIHHSYRHREPNFLNRDYLRRLRTFRWRHLSQINQAKFITANVFRSDRHYEFSARPRDDPKTHDK